MINIVMDSINESLFLKPQTKAELSLVEKLIVSFSFVDQIRHGVFLHDYFMTFAVIPPHKLSCFCILFLNVAIVRWYVLPAVLLSLLFMLCICSDTVHLSVLAVLYLKVVTVSLDHLLKFLHIYCTFIPHHTK